MANPTIVEKIQARYNAKRTANSQPVVDFAGYTMSAPEVYSGPQSADNTLLYANPTAASPNFGRIKIFLNRSNMNTAVGITIKKGTATRVSQLLVQLGNEFGLTFTADDFVDDVLGAGSTFTLSASVSNRLLTGSTTVSFED